jgi:phosphohistidine swiveling domain-containing protein/protein-tyrosine-phosphatase
MRFFHTVEKIIFLDGDDVRRAPMAAALFRQFASEDQLMRLWRTEVSSAGSGKYTVAGAFPVKDAQLAMNSLGLYISSHQAEGLSLSTIEEASLILAIEPKHVQYARSHVCHEYPACGGRVVSFFEYLGAADLQFDSLIGSDDVSEYVSFAQWMKSLLPRLAYRLRQDTRLPLLARGEGLGSAVVQGPVRVVGGPKEAQHIQKGDVVVFKKVNVIEAAGRGRLESAAAIVAESGEGMSGLSHLSHELRIPCVGGVGDAGELLPDGQRVMVDATCGLVYGVNEDAAEYDS